MRLDKRLLKEAGGLRRYLGILGLQVSLAAALTVGQAYCLAVIINGIFLKHQALAQVGWPLAILLAVMLGRAGLGWYSEVLGGKLAGKVKSRLRRKLFAHLLKLGPVYTKGERSGELSNTMTEGVEALDPYLGQYLPQLVATAITPPVVLVVVVANDWLSGLVLLLTAPLLPFFMALIGWLSESQAKKQWRSMSLMSAHFLDVLQGLTTLKLFGRSQPQREIIERISNQFRQATMRVLRIAFLSALVLELGATLSTAVVAVEIGLRLLYGQVGFEAAFFVLLLTPEFYLPLRALGVKYHAGQAGSAAVNRIFEILETPVDAPATTETTPSPTGTGGLKIRFENVSYTYPGGVQPALQNVSFEIEAGQQIALVGPSGSGKSTLAALLLRFGEPQQGRITCNGQALSGLDVAQWRKLVAWVPQRPYLFNATVAENIRLGRSDASLDEVKEAARQAQAHEFIEKLPQGYDTVIGERGCRLSGGQSQRLSLARAFLKDAPLLILDEATANLDSTTEAAVVEATARLAQGRTVLTIAHRLNTLQGVNRVIRLEEGQVAASCYNEILGQARELTSLGAALL